MIAQHCLIGNIPGRGHGVPLLSPAFPSGSVSKDYRAPDPARIPEKAFSVSDDRKYLFFVLTFEILASGFGQFSLIRTSCFRPVNNENLRPYMCLNGVMMTDENGMPLRFLSPEVLLTFHDFVQPAQFLQLKPISNSIDASVWQPGPCPARKPFFKTAEDGMHRSMPTDEMHLALLTRYWQAASSLLFGGRVQPVSICLSDRMQPRDIIEDAKALLLCDILPHLPPAVSNIASMSAGATMSSVKNKFSGSALAVVYPSEVDQNTFPEFDLRDRVYPRVNIRFIDDLLHDRHCGFIKNAIARYMEQTDCPDPSQISFVADYDVMHLLYRLECTVNEAPSALPLSDCLPRWQQLRDRLTKSHRLSIEQVNHILLDAEREWLSFLCKRLSGEGLFSSLTFDIVTALWEKMLTVSDELVPSFEQLIAASLAASSGASSNASLAASLVASSGTSLDASFSASSFPQIIEHFSNLTDKQVERTASLIRKISECHYKTHPLSADLAAQMASEGFLSVVQRYPKLRDAVCDLLRTVNDAFPEDRLITLPPSCALLGGSQALEAAIESLLQRIPQLPEASQIGNLSAAYRQHATQKAGCMLCDYFAACLPGHLDNLNPLLDTILSVMPETSAACCALLYSAEQSSILLNAGQTKLLLHRLLQRCADSGSVREAYTRYEQSLSAHRDNPPQARLLRLADCANVLRSIGFDATAPVTQLLSAFGNQFLSPEQTGAFVSALWPLCCQQETVNDAFRQYLLGITRDEPQYYFAHIDAFNSLAPLIQVTHTDMTETVCGILLSLANIEPCAPAPKLLDFVKLLLPLCSNREGVIAQLFAYIEQSIQVTAVDCFPWLQSVEARCMQDGLLLKADENRLAKTIFAYILGRCEYSACPDASAFSWIISLFGRREQELYSAIILPLLNLYEALLKSGQPRRELCMQLDQLLPYFSSTSDFPSLHAYDRQRTCEQFQSLLQTSELDKALLDMDASMRRCGLTSDMLLHDAENRQAAKAALSRTYAQAFRNPSSLESLLSCFEGKYSRHPSTEKDRLLNEVLAEQLETLIQQRRSKPCTLKDMDALNKTSELILGQIRCPEPARLRQMAEAAKQILPNQLSDAAKELQAIHVHLSDTIEALNELLCPLLPTLHEQAFICAALLCSLRLKTDKLSVDWLHLCSMLNLEIADPLPKPYSAEGLSWIASIHAICRVLDGLPKHLGESFLRFLNEGVFGSFTDNLLRDRKRRKQYLPEESIQSGLMRRWLQI